MKICQRRKVAQRHERMKLGMGQYLPLWIRILTWRSRFVFLFFHFMGIFRITFFSSAKTRNNGKVVLITNRHSGLVQDARRTYDRSPPTLGTRTFLPHLPLHHMNALSSAPSPLMMLTNHLPFRSSLEQISWNADIHDSRTH